MKKFSLAFGFLLLLTLVLSACDSTPKPASTVAPTTTAPATVASTTAAPTSAPTTVAATAVSAPRPTSATTTVPAAFPVTVSDASGNNITLNKKAERVVCVGPACIEIMADLNTLPVASTFMALVRRPEFFGQRADQIIEISGTTAEPNLEQIVQAKPDLIIGEEGITMRLRDALKKVTPVFEVKVAGYEEAIKNLRDVGKLTGLSIPAEALIDKFRAKLANYAAKSPKDKTAVLMSDYAVNTTFTTEKAAICLILKEVSKGCPLPPPPTGNMVRGRFAYSLELVLEANPDALFVGVNPTHDAAKNAQSKQTMGANPFWKEFKAVKTGQVFEVDTQIWVRTELRSLNLMLDEAMSKLYPSVFPKN
jgi:iron complex transport system substrate-binding protein